MEAQLAQQQQMLDNQARRAQQVEAERTQYAAALNEAQVEMMKKERRKELMV